MNTARALSVALSLSVVSAFLAAQGAPASPRADSVRQASQLDMDGAYAKARAMFKLLIDGAPDPVSKMQVQRALAISYAFTGDCASAAAVEEKAIDYWKTREQAEPQNAFYQEGEVSNEAARICFDAGDYSAAERYYRRGSELGLKEPEPKTHPASLWDFRLTHALARINVRRGDTDAAFALVARAKIILVGDKAMAVQQDRFFPHLEAYVTLYAPHSLPVDDQLTERLLKEAIAFKGNENDPYLYWLLAEFYRRHSAGRPSDAAIEYCQKAYARATVHNPPAAFVRPLAKACLSGSKSPPTRT
jgi:tetratricopeptide (TPR) repeat protein